MVNVFGMFGFFQRNRSRGKVPVMSMSCTLMDRIFWLFLRKSSSQHIVFKRAIPPERLPSSQLTEIYSFRPGNCASQKPFKINNGCTSIVEGFWPVSPVAHFPASRCHGSIGFPGESEKFCTLGILSAIDVTSTLMYLGDTGKDSSQKLTDVSSRNAAGPSHLSRLQQRFVHHPHTAHPTHSMGTGVFLTPRALPHVTPCKSSEESVRWGVYLPVV